MSVLFIKSSILGAYSKSDLYAQKLIEKKNFTNVVVRDVVGNPVTPLSWNVIEEIKAKSGNVYSEHKTLIEEFKKADTLVISAPMYNFTIPSQLHTYFDAVIQAGETFRYTPEGIPVGLAGDKKVYVVISRGGKYKEAGFTAQEDTIRQQLAFMGITDVSFIFLEGLAMGVTEEELSKVFEDQIV